MTNQSSLGALDYVVLILILLFSILIGVYYGFKDDLALIWNRVKNTFYKPKSNKIVDIELKSKENKTLDEEIVDKLNEYLTASSSMGILPITFSLMASFFSATGIVGIPTEVCL